MQRHHQPDMPIHTRYWELDFIRFFAAFAVMALHYFIRGFAANDTISPFHFPTLGPLVRYGYLAVNIFFMISGFVILMSTRHSAAGTPGAITFLKTRALRLYPAFWVACTLTFACVRIFEPELITLSWARYFLNLTMLNGLVGIGNIDGPYWTLLVEIKFYVLIALAIWFNLLKHTTGLITVFLLISGLNYFVEAAWLEHVFFTNYMPYFCAGAIFYLCKTQGWRPSSLVLLGMSFAIGLAYDLDALTEKSLHYGLEFSQVTLVACVSAFYLIFICIGIVKKSPLPKLAAILGGISYPIYLLHNNIGMVIFNRAEHLATPLVITVGTMVLICLASYIVYSRIEPWVKTRLKRILFTHDH